MKKRILGVLLVAAMSMSLMLGCGKGNNEGGSSADDSSAKDGDIKVASIVLQEDQFQKLLGLAMKRAADAEGVEIQMTHSAGQLDKEVELINNYTASGVDGICLFPVSLESSAPALQEAYNKGVKIYSVNMDMDAEFQAGYVEADQANLGELTGKACKQYIEEELGGKAKIGILQFKSQLPEMSAARTNGFLKEIEGMDGVEIVADVDAWMAEQAVAKATEILNAHPDIDIIWAANEGGTVGATMAVKNAGKAGDIVVFGTDTGEQLATMLLDEDNILQFITGQNPDVMGEEGMKNLIHAIRGEEVEEKIVVPGVPLSRQNPEEVQAYLDDLKAKLGGAE